MLREDLAVEVDWSALPWVLSFLHLEGGCNARGAAAILCARDIPGTAEQTQVCIPMVCCRCHTFWTVSCMTLLVSEKNKALTLCELLLGESSYLQINRNQQAFSTETGVISR